MSCVALLFRLRDGGNSSELLAFHPGLNVPFCLLLRDPGARLAHRAELPLGVDRGAIEVGQKGSFLLRILHVAPFARDRVGAFATLEPEHGWSPRERAAQSWVVIHSSFQSSRILNGYI